MRISSRHSAGLRTCPRVKDQTKSRHWKLCLQLPEPSGCFTTRTGARQSSLGHQAQPLCFPAPLPRGVWAADIPILKPLPLTLKCKQSLLAVITLFHSANTVYYSWLCPEMSSGRGAAAPLETSHTRWQHSEQPLALCLWKTSKFRASTTALRENPSNFRELGLTNPFCFSKQPLTAPCAAGLCTYTHTRINTWEGSSVWGF